MKGFRRTSFHFDVDSFVVSSYSRVILTITQVKSLNLLSLAERLFKVVLAC